MPSTTPSSVVANLSKKTVCEDLSIVRMEGTPKRFNINQKPNHVLKNALTSNKLPIINIIQTISIEINQNIIFRNIFIKTYRPRLIF